MVLELKKRFKIYNNFVIHRGNSMKIWFMKYRDKKI